MTISNQMILLRTPFSADRIGLNENETVFQLMQRISVFLNHNFQYRFQECETGRFLPDDEVILPDREYYLTPFQ